MKIHSTITVDNETFQLCQIKGLNISEICEIALRAAVSIEDFTEIKALNDKIQSTQTLLMQYQLLRENIIAKEIRHTRMVKLIRQDSKWFLPLKEEYDKLAADEREAWFETYARKKAYDLIIFKEEFMRSYASMSKTDIMT